MSIFLNGRTFHSYSTQEDNQPATAEEEEGEGEWKEIRYPMQIELILAKAH